MRKNTRILAFKKIKKMLVCGLTPFRCGQFSTMLICFGIMLIKGDTLSSILAGVLLLCCSYPIIAVGQRP